MEHGWIRVFVLYWFSAICSLTNMLSCNADSPELEKGLKKRVKLHTHENGQNGQNGQNGEIDSDDNYTEVKNTSLSSRPKQRQNGAESNVSVFVCAQDIMSPLQEENGCDEEEDEEEGREEEDEFDSDESLVDSDSDSDEKGASSFLSDSPCVHKSWSETDICSKLYIPVNTELFTMFFGFLDIIRPTD